MEEEVEVSLTFDSLALTAIHSNEYCVLKAAEDSLRCIYCKEFVKESYIDVHLRTDHKIDHEEAVHMLKTLQYSQPLQYLSLQPQHNHVDHSTHLDQVPVNESDNHTFSSTDRYSRRRLVCMDFY